MRKHRKQFIIARRVFQPFPDWKSLALDGGYWLSYDRDLAIEVDESTGALVLGIGLQIEDPRGSGDLKARYTGRFVSIDWPRIYTDAGALLSLFYVGDDQEFIVTSSIALFAELFGKEPDTAVDLEWSGINWVPGPGSRSPYLRKLFCDQAINFETHSIEKAEWGLQPHPTEADAAQALARRLVLAIQALAKRFNTIYLGMTAGLDSRTFLAAFLASGVDFRTITHSFPGMDRMDLQTAERLSARFGFAHSAITPLPRNPNLLQQWEEHTGRGVWDADAEHFIPGDHYRFLLPNDLMVRGNCVEICRRWYDFKLRNIRHDLDGAKLWQAFDRRPVARPYADYFDEWLVWRRTHPIGLDPVECFYLDQRVGGWVSAGEQGYDLLDGHSLQLINSLSFYSDLISGTNHALRTGRIQKKAIEILRPELLEVPVNPIGLFDFHKRGKYAAKKLFRGWKAVSETLVPPVPRGFAVAHSN
jgi:hypothetical protein